MGWGLGYFGSPHILINFMSINDVHEMHKAKYVGISWMTLVLGAATCAGLIGLVYFKTPLANRELVFIEMVRDLFHPLFAGFILCAILAATMSVMTAQILATASIITEDFFKPLLKSSISQQQYLMIIRGCIIALPILAYLVSYTSTQSINDLIAYAWSGLGLSFAPTVLASLFIPWATKRGVQSALLVGGLLGMFWGTLGFTIMPLLPGCIICMSILLGISYLTQKKVVL